MTITAEQLRGARAMLRMEQGELAALSGVSLGTVKRLEGVNGTTNAQANTLDAMQSALVRSGVQFIDANSALGLGPGVRLLCEPTVDLESLVQRLGAMSPEQIDALLRAADEAKE